MIFLHVAHQIRISAIFILMRKFYLTYPVSSRGKDKNKTAQRWKTSDIIVRLKGSLDLPERLKLPERSPKYQKDQRIYNWTILCTRDCFTRAFTAAIKAWASLRLPHTPTPIHIAVFPVIQVFPVNLGIEVKVPLK